MEMSASLSSALSDARDRARAGGRGTFVSVVRSARTDVDPAALYTEDGPTSVLWQQPDRDVHIVGRGVAADTGVHPGPSRFDDARAALADTLERLTVVHIDRSPVLPILLGGFSFADDTRWEVGPGRLVLPELTYVRRDGRAAWIRSTGVGPDTDIDDVEATLTRELAHLAQLGGGWRPPLPVPPAHPVDPGDQEYPKMVRQALDAIERGQVDKLVVARAADLEPPFDLIGVLATLRERYPGCVTFAFRFGQEVFIGATPELLVRVRHGRLQTAAVAGTAPRGEGFEEDHALGMSLLSSEKDRREHGYVYGEIRARLAKAGVHLDDLRAPEILKLAGLQHLWTRITGDVPDGTSLLGIVGALHPTPAVAGLPVDVSRRWLIDHENLDRGWYAGPIGFLDSSGDGEFHVALRSAHIDSDRARLFAGAGVVAGSKPERELAETELKFQAVGRAVRAAS
jgi:isochorismate synthase